MDDEKKSDYGVITTRNIDISVIVLTYYHEQYIKQALDSILSQDTSYTYEIQVSDDCSQDGTRQILERYQRDFPDIVNLHFNETNLGIPTNLYEARCRCRGKYICMLAGDDYIIDSKKLELQARYLDEHPDRFAVACVQENRYDNDTVAYSKNPGPKLAGRDYTFEDWERAKVVYGTGTLMMRNILREKEGREYFRLLTEASQRIDDTTDLLLVTLKGPVYVIDRSMIAHRVQRIKEGKHNYTSVNTGVRHYMHYIEMLNNLDDYFCGAVDFRTRYIASSSTGLLASLIEHRMGEFRAIYKTIPKRYKGISLNMSVLVKCMPVGFRALIQKAKSKQ